jgi:hypothetical protein
MKKRGDACGCVHRFLNHFPLLKITELKGLRYEDDVCVVECDGRVIKSYTYEVVNGARYRSGECVMSLW